ncbi:MAG: valine--tRNA ligase [Actinobacteria bacterium]|nr:valine--tRNA ligase [Actinomycetota bacterium]
MGRIYDPRQVEDRWYSYWEEKGYFHADETSDRDPFSMVIPPPNVTGILHMGHALNNTLQDIIARRKRMQGFEVLWVPGTDHAGIATQNVVERQLEKEGTDRHELGREKFVERVWQWKEQYGGTIISQLKRLGCSCDWGRERFTMDDGCSLAVRTVFKQLYDQGLIYRGEYIINWCPRCHTAISDIEVEHLEKNGNLWHIQYPMSDGSGRLVVATTRPETMLGDTAVAVNPDDKRYSSIVGKTVILPLVGREIPVIEDRFVDPDFGTGAVKVTPAHDPNDFEIGNRHGLERVNIMNPDGTINENGNLYEGLDRYEARTAVVSDLDKEGLLVKTDDHLHAVGRCYRCDTEVEPYLSTQWFVKMSALAVKGIEVVRDGGVTFTPERWAKVYFEWMENIRDWCISRQLWWGHRIPVWYCESCGRELVEVEKPEACQCGCGELSQDPDVLDTWFSSGLWPFSTLGWPENTQELTKFYPTNVLTTAFDIIFFWVARMIMMGLRFMDDVPFHEVYVTALVRDYEGKKMSKSSGNIIDPIGVIDVFGTDALRFTLASIAVPGRDINMSEERVESNRNFANKIWNASRLVLSNADAVHGPLKRLLCGGDNDDWFEQEELELADWWIIQRLFQLAETMDRAMEAFNFSVAGKAIYQFFWGDYCDWYLEIAKLRFYQADEDKKRTAQSVAMAVLEASLRLLHPFMPFITEEIWQKLPVSGESIMIEKWPEARRRLEDEKIALDMESIQSVVVGIRSARSEHGIPPNDKVNGIFLCEADELREVLEREKNYVTSLTGLPELIFGEKVPGESYGIRVVVPAAEIYLSWSGGVDRGDEIDRLGKRLAKVEADLERCVVKLSNEAFIKKAPDEIIKKERAKQEELLSKRDKMNRQIKALGG